MNILQCGFFGDRPQAIYKNKTENLEGGLYCYGGYSTMDEILNALVTALRRMNQFFDPEQMATEDLAKIVSAMESQANELAAISLKVQIDLAKAHQRSKSKLTIEEQQERIAEYLQYVDYDQQRMKRFKTEDPDYYGILCTCGSETDTPEQAKMRKYLKKARPDLFAYYRLNECGS